MSDDYLRLDITKIRRVSVTDDHLRPDVTNSGDKFILVNHMQRFDWAEICQYVNQSIQNMIPCGPKWILLQFKYIQSEFKWLLNWVTI